MLHLTESPLYLQTFVQALQYFQIFHVVSELSKVELTHRHLRERSPRVPAKVLTDTAHCLIAICSQ